MRFIYYCAFATVMCAVNARRITFDEHDMPIRVVETSYGQGDHERVDYLEAVIQPHHVNTNGRIDFPTSGKLNDYYLEARDAGDLRGHLVAAQFSGPAEWYNLSPQNAHVNRNEDYQALTTDWYKAECKVRNFLSEGENRYVNWRVRMKHVKDSNRPDEYHLMVNFIENGQDRILAINIRTRNPFFSEERTFWACQACGTSICKSLLVISD